MATYTRNMELFEYTRTQRRSGKKIPVQKRTQMLLDAGYTQQEIIQSSMNVVALKCQRAETLRTLKIPQVFEKLSKNFMLGFNSLKIVVGPKPSKTTVSAPSA